MGPTYQQPFNGGLPRGMIFTEPFPAGTPGYGMPGPGMGFMFSPPIWQPYVAAMGKFGNDRSNGFGQLMIPLFQDGQSLLFADLRGRFDDDDNREGNFGLGLRMMIDPYWIVGAYGFYDLKRTDSGNTFQQGTFGIEALSVPFEARLNGYIPESGAEPVDGLNDAQLIGNSIFVRCGQERAYYGIDGEIGALLAEDCCGGGGVELRGFVGGYHFNTSANGFPDVTGPRGRLEVRAYDLSWFGPESRLTLGIELQWDKVRDTQVAGVARVEIPIGFFGGARKLSRLERRMLDRIVRDDDVVTVAQRGPREVGMDPLTGRLLSNVNVINAKTTTSTELAAAVAELGENSTVILDGGAGPISTDFSIEVQDGQVLRGGGFGAIGSQTGCVATFGTRPTIVNTNNQEKTINVANNATVADLNVIGGSDGISSYDANNITIVGNQVSGAEQDGFHFDGTLTNSTVMGNTASHNGNDGFDFDNLAAGSMFTGNTASNNTDDGFDIDSVAAGSMFAGNIASGNTDDGFKFGNNLNPSPISGTISRNIATGNGFDLFDPVGNGFSFINDIAGTVTNNVANGNSNNGFTGNNNANFTNNGTFNNNTANSNSGWGYRGTNAGIATGNTGTDNGDGDLFP